MFDDYDNYLYILNTMNTRHPLEVPEIKELYDKYNELFPDYPLSDNFFFDNNEYEVMEKLKTAIGLNAPIRTWTR